MDTKHIKISDYNYELPDERIAKFPLAQRDHSKLLIYKHGWCSTACINYQCLDHEDHDADLCKNYMQRFTSFSSSNAASISLLRNDV